MVWHRRLGRLCRGTSGSGSVNDRVAEIARVRGDEVNCACLINLVGTAVKFRGRRGVPAFETERTGAVCLRWWIPGLGIPRRSNRFFNRFPQGEARHQGGNSPGPVDCPRQIEFTRGKLEFAIGTRVWLPVFSKYRGAALGQIDERGTDRPVAQDSCQSWWWMTGVKMEVRGAW